MLQNLVVEPEYDANGEATGCYFVTIGEGRRQAQLLRVKRRQIKKTEPIRCVLDTANDPHEISLDENVTRQAMHPADQFEAFRQLSEERGWSAEEIAARFGVTAHVVRQRLRLGSVSPRLMQTYRDGGLTLDQLMAFAITADHDRQEQVFDALQYNREPYFIRRELTRSHVGAKDRKAVFVGAQAYVEAGGTILRDLFTEDGGGYLEDAALLDRMVFAKLETIAEAVIEAEGWKWFEVHVDFPHAHGLRRVWPQSVALSDEDAAALTVAVEAFAVLSEEWDSAEELPEEIDAQFGELEAEIDRLEAKRQAYDSEDIARGGVFVGLNHDGSARIERGFIRPEVAQQELSSHADAGGEGRRGTENGRIVAGVRITEDGEIIDGPEGVGNAEDAQPDEPGDDGKPVSDALIRDLTAHRTLALRLALGEQPQMALVAVTHALAAQAFYRGMEAHCLELRWTSSHLAASADGIEDTAAAKALADRHAAWAAELPRDIAGLWDHVAALGASRLMDLFAHCASLSVNAVKQPWERKPLALVTAEKLASALTLDMAAHWQPTANSYLGRVTKAHIIAAVHEAVSSEAAERIASLKKPDMVEAAEQLLAGTGWLPVVLRTDEAATPDGTTAPEQVLAQATAEDTDGEAREEPTDTGHFGTEQADETDPVAETGSATAQDKVVASSGDDPDDLAGLHPADDARDRNTTPRQAAE